MIPKKRYLLLHELPYTEMVKSGTIRFALDCTASVLLKTCTNGNVADPERFEADLDPDTSFYINVDSEPN